jgi:exopolysaccharide biosynthesis polyprenyl glycosylphosphotransferase
MINKKIKQITLLLGDIFFLYFSLYLSLLIRRWQVPGNEQWNNHLNFFIFIFVIFVIIFYINELYQLKRINGKIINNIIKSSMISLILSMIFFYLIPQRELSPKTTLIIFSFIFSVMAIIWREFFKYILQNKLPKNNLGFIGYNEITKELLKEKQGIEKNNYQIKFIINEQEIINLDDEKIKYYKNINELPRLIKKYKINNLILSDESRQSNEVQKMLFDCLPKKINYLTLSRFYEEITNKIPLTIVNKAWFLENINLANKNIFETGKRFIDLFLSAISLIFLVPLSLIISIIIKIDSSGPVFFKQQRIGQKNKIFIILKFRTMKNNSHNRPTLFNDPRITKFGSFLRKTRLDEIPQIINIIKGEMSFIGPRPERPDLAEKLESNIPFYGIRHLIKPGITGWDQVSGEYHSPSIEDTYKKLQYDLYYLKNRSLFIDLTIILKTIKIALSRQGW